MVKQTGEFGQAKSDEAEASNRRKHARANLPLKARFLDENGSEWPCLVLNVSAGGALLQTDNPPAFGRPVVLYVDRLGRFEGIVTRSTDNKFAIHYEKNRERSAKVADDITEVMHKGRRSLDRRITPRIEQDSPALVHFEDGDSQECSLIDISLTGASLEVSPRPALGTRLILGRMTAKVVRRHDTGVSVVFTASAARMDDVISDAAATDDPPKSGTQFAPTFGKKT